MCAQYKDVFCAFGHIDFCNNMIYHYVLCDKSCRFLQIYNIFTTPLQLFQIFIHVLTFWKDILHPEKATLLQMHGIQMYIGGGQ